MTPGNPPEGAPWDLPITGAPLAFVDLEMTGLDPKKDRVIEVCVHRVVGEGIVARVATLVRPDDEPGAARVGDATHVHGLDATSLAGAPTYAEAWPAIRDALDGAIVVAHAAEWDVRFLVAEAARLGATLELPFVLDTLVLARRAFAMKGGYSLDALCAALGIERGRAHRAEPDVVAMRGLFARCVSALAPSSPRDLWEVRIAERRARASIVEACEGAVRDGKAVVVTYRPSRKGPEPMEMILTSVSRALDPPRVVGYQLPGRGRRELRADRILKVEPAR